MKYEKWRNFFLGNELRRGFLKMLDITAMKEICAAELSKIREVKRTSDGWTLRNDGGRVSVVGAR